MALTLANSAVQSGDCLTITWTDDTDYGAPELLRSEVTVTWIVTHKLSSGDVDITPSHNPLVDTSIQITITDIFDEGYIEVSMTVDEIAGPFNETFVRAYGFTCFLQKCIVETRSEWVKNDIKDCEDPKLTEKLEKLDNYNETIINLFDVEANPVEAELIHERAADICSDTVC